MKIIDFDRNGNIVRFYLGEKIPEWGWTNPNYKDSTGMTPTWLKPSEKYYGDDWDDQPYEHNAGLVYAEFIKSHVDLYVPKEFIVLEPSDGKLNSIYSKDSLKENNIPCILIITKELYERSHYSDYFEDYCYLDNNEGVIKIYFEDDVAKLVDIQKKVLPELPLLNWEEF